MPYPPIIAVVGPTASGKSSLAIRLATKLRGEIVSADSRQVYRGMDIGTGKVTKAEQRLVPHHLLDVANPKQVFTVADFVRNGNRKLKEIYQRGNIPVVVGGTGFWIDSLLNGQTLPSVPPNPVLRKKLAKWTTQALVRTLQKLDPERAKNIDTKNRVRLIRALEIVMQTGKPVPQQKQTRVYNVLWLGIDPGKGKLHKNIHRRLHARFKQGMVAEVKKLLKAGVPKKRLLDLGLEYRYITLFLQGNLTKHEMVKKLEHEIQHYAKRQRTWFKRNQEIHWIHSPVQALRLVKVWMKKQGIK
ncbi:MAG: tRNA (adenosine(37)-N6)-dimethylallyltransferase MiaA [Patescibacteria group bacterium]|jgi:tRNA dimethylallyltransferase